MSPKKNPLVDFGNTLLFLRTAEARVQSWIRVFFYFYIKLKTNNSYVLCRDEVLLHLIKRNMAYNIASLQFFRRNNTTSLHLTKNENPSSNVSVRYSARFKRAFEFSP